MILLSFFSYFDRIIWEILIRNYWSLRIEFLIFLCVTIWKVKWRILIILIINLIRIRCLNNWINLFWENVMFINLLDSLFSVIYIYCDAFYEILIATEIKANDKEYGCIQNERNYSCTILITSAKSQIFQKFFVSDIFLHYRHCFIVKQTFINIKWTCFLINVKKHHYILKQD